MGEMGLFIKLKSLKYCTVMKSGSKMAVWKQEPPACLIYVPFLHVW